MAALDTPDLYLRGPEVKVRTGLSRTTIHRMTKTGDFPAPRKLGKRAVGWLASDIAQWMEQRNQVVT